MSEPATVPVCFVASNAQLGGTELFLESVLGALESPWIDRVLVLGEGPFADRLASAGHAVDTIASGRRLGMLKSAFRMRRLLRRRPPAVIHANGVKAALVAVLATTGTRIPVIWQKQDCARDGRLALFIARRCGLVVGVSNAVLATFDGQHSLERTVIPNAIPVYEVDREEARARLLTTIGVQGEAAVVGQVARLHPAKGQLELLEVAARLRPDIPDLHLVFIGDPDPCEPDYPSRLRSRCADLGIDGSVRFLGHRNDAVTLMAGCDVLALPSLPDPVSGWREGFPLSSLEAMAVGTPVVGYDEPALVEQLGNCGRLVPSGDREALCSVLGEVLADASVQEDMRACGRRRGRRYELPGAVRQLKDAFVETAVRRPGRVSG